MCYLLRGEFHADSAIADEAGGAVEHRLPAYLEPLLRAIGIDPAEDEIQEWFPRGNAGIQQRPLRLVPAAHRRTGVFSRQGVDADAEHLQNRTGNLGELHILVLLPVPVGSQFGQAAIARFAFAQFGSPLLNRLFQFLAVILEFLVQQPYLQQVVDARLDFKQIERLADEILGAGLQGAQLVARLSGDHQDAKVGVGIIGLESFHHLKSAHARHLKVEQDQVVAVLAMQSANLLWIHGRGHAGVAGLAEQLFEQADIGLLIVDDQDTGVQYVGLSNAHVVTLSAARSVSAFADSSAPSSASMNSLTLMGLVR